MFKKKEPKLKKLKEKPKLEPVLPSTPEPEKLTPQEDKLELTPQVSPEPPKDPDYLRQYQYKKVNGGPMVGGPLTDPDSGSKALIMKKSLLGQSRVKFMIPRPESEDPSIKLSVTLNGYRLDFPKNVFLEVPYQIAEIISESLGLQASALLPFQIGRNQKTLDALS